MINWHYQTAVEFHNTMRNKRPDGVIVPSQPDIEMPVPGGNAV
jgi:hypothetical protein